MNKIHTNEETIGKLKELLKDDLIDEIRQIVESDKELLTYWFESAKKDIFNKLKIQQFRELCDRFDLYDLDIPTFLQDDLELEDIPSKFNKNYCFFPKSFLISAHAIIDKSINKMAKLDYINFNPYLDEMNILCKDKDGIGIKKCDCKYEVFNGKIKGLSVGDANKFERFLASSISLSKSEKLHIIRNIETLSLFQIEELIKIFEEEIIKFSKMNFTLQKDLEKKYISYEKDWQEIVQEIKKERLISEKTHKELIFDKHNNFTPQAIFSYLSEHVIGQNEAKKKISTALYYQTRLFKSLDTTRDFDKVKDTQNESMIKPIGPILFAGYTGSGKTFTIQKGIEFTNLNFLHVDTSSLVENGIVGNSIDDIAKNIIRKAKYDTHLAEHSIVFFDECDKLLNKDNGQAVIAQLLRFTEGADISIVLSQNDYDRDKFNSVDFLSTKKMLIVFGGAFSWISDKKTVGFGDASMETRNLSHDEIEKSGFPKELLGRIKQTVILDRLNEDDYYKILTQSANSPLNEYIHKIEINDDKVVIEDGVLRKIANIAAQSEFGVRKISHLLEELFDDIMFQSPENKIETFEIKLVDLEEIE